MTTSKTWLKQALFIEFIMDTIPDITLLQTLPHLLMMLLALLALLAQHLHLFQGHQVSRVLLAILDFRETRAFQDHQASQVAQFLDLQALEEFLDMRVQLETRVHSARWVQEVSLVLHGRVLPMPI